MTIFAAYHSEAQHCASAECSSLAHGKRECGKRLPQRSGLALNLSARVKKTLHENAPDARHDTSYAPPYMHTCSHTIQYKTSQYITTPYHSKPYLLLTFPWLTLREHADGGRWSQPLSIIALVCLGKINHKSQKEDLETMRVFCGSALCLMADKRPSHSLCHGKFKRTENWEHTHWRNQNRTE